MKRRIFVCISMFVFAAVMLFVYDIFFRQQEIHISGTMPLKSEEELILSSDLIVEGEVLRALESRWSNEDFRRGDAIANVLQTDIEIKIDEIISGNDDNKIVRVRIDTGKYRNKVFKSDLYPDFSDKERVLLFLSRDNSDTATDENYYVLTGMKQGKYVMSEDNPTMYINTVNGEERRIDISSFDEKVNELKAK